MSGSTLRPKESPSQTAGPYVQIGLTPGQLRVVHSEIDDLGSGPLEVGLGEKILVCGRVLDGSAEPVSDAIIELWQADSDGTYRNGWGRTICDDNGVFGFDTVKPGRVENSPGNPMAPHLTLWIVARGISIGLHTRVYFDDEEEANKSDAILALVDPDRRRTLLSNRSQVDGKTTYTLEIHLQGKNETVFFDV